MILAALLLANHRVLIGNFLTTAPSGIAFIYELPQRLDGEKKEESQVWRPSPDGRMQRLEPNQTPSAPQCLSGESPQAATNLRPSAKSVAQFAGSSINRDDEKTAAFLIDIAAPYRAETSAPDDSFHRIDFERDGAQITFEWGRVGDSAIARITTDKVIDLELELKQTWPDIKTIYQPSPIGASATSNGIDWSMRCRPEPTAMTDHSAAVHINPGHASYFVAGFGRLPAFDKIDATLDEAQKRYESHKSAATGQAGDFLGAIVDNLNNSRIYSSDNQLLAHTVSRGWASTPNTAPYFCWDSFFNGNLASIEDPITARDTVRAILSCQTEDGLVPNFGHWNFDGGRVSKDRSQPPVGSMCIWKMHQRWPDKAFLEEVYPKLVTWHRWWPKARDGNHNGLLEWGSATGQLQGAKWETGWDDTVHFEGAEMVGSNMNADAVDLNSLWAMDAEYLASIADAIGKKDEAKQWRNEHAEICERMNRELWNPALGIYCSKLWNGQFLTRLTPMNFYPLIAGVPDAERAKKVLAVMTDPKRFWGDWILPTVAYDDPVWPQQDYWKGKVWAPVNYLVFQGLLRYADAETLDHFADRSRELFMRNWTSKGVCGENYLSKDGTQSSDPHYTWGALLCLIALENVVHLESDGKVWLNGTFKVQMNLHNVPLNGTLYQVRVQPGETQLVSERTGHTVVTAKGKIVRARLGG